MKSTKVLLDPVKKKKKTVKSQEVSVNRGKIPINCTKVVEFTEAVSRKHFLQQLCFVIAKNVISFCYKNIFTNKNRFEGD